MSIDKVIYDYLTEQDKIKTKELLMGYVTGLQWKPDKGHQIFRKKSIVLPEAHIIFMQYLQTAKNDQFIAL